VGRSTERHLDELVGPAEKSGEKERIDLLDEGARMSLTANETAIGVVQNADVLIIRAAPLRISRDDLREVPSARCRPVDVVGARRQNTLHCGHSRHSNNRLLHIPLAAAAQHGEDVERSDL